MARPDQRTCPAPGSEARWLQTLLWLGTWLRGDAHGLWVEKRFGGGARVQLLDGLLPLFLYIRDRKGCLIRLHPNPAQRLFAQRRSERNIILKARQLGMTTYIAARFFLATILRPGTVTLQVAHSLESAQQIFRIVHRFLVHLPGNVGRVIRTTRANVRELAFGALDSRYIVDTAGNRNAGRGLTVQNLHASEVALWPGDPRETMAALLAAVPPGGTVEIESTPRGVGGYFHSEWLRSAARQEPDSFTPHFFPWWLDPAYRLPLPPNSSLAPLSEEEELLVGREGLDAEQIAFRRRLRKFFGDLTPQEFAEEPASCFLVTGRPVFDVAVIEARLRQIPSPREEAQNGAVQVWLPPEEGREYIAGADVAEGVGRGDFSAAVVLDAETGLQCAELLARWPIHRFAEELARLAARFNHALIAVERNNQGHGVLYALQHTHAYPHLYHHPESSGAAKAGWPMNSQTKPQAIQILGRMLREAPHAFASARLLEQCRNYSYADDGDTRARAGDDASGHDDLVMAAAIAFAVRKRTAGHK